MPRMSEGMHPQAEARCLATLRARCVGGSAQWKALPLAARLLSYRRQRLLFLSHIEEPACRQSECGHSTVATVIGSDLVDAHAAAGAPGVGVPVAAMLSHPERESGEFIAGRWICAPPGFAVQNGRVAAAAHLPRCGDDEGAAQLRELMNVRSSNHAHIR